MTTFWLSTALSLQTVSAFADDAPACNGICVLKEDMAAIVTVLNEKKCLQTEKPTFALDPITIITDRQGRIYYSGGDPKPYTVKMHWCSYDVTAQGKLDVVAAVQKPPVYGFEFRPKAYAGYLLAEPFRAGLEAKDGIDAGLMLDPFHVYDFNIDVHVGFRSFGVGIGLDVFRSFGLYGGYAMTWDGFRSNPEAALWFAFW